MTLRLTNLGPTAETGPVTVRVTETDNGGKLAIVARPGIRLFGSSAVFVAATIIVARWVPGGIWDESTNAVNACCC